MPQQHYRPTPDTFRKYGADFTLQKRTGLVALYEYLGESGKGYELVVLRQQEAKTLTIRGVVSECEATEVYPSSSQWGIFGWTFMHTPTEHARALTRFDDLVRRNHPEMMINKAVRKRKK